VPDHVTHRRLHIKYAPVALPPAMLVCYFVGDWYMVLFGVLGYILHRWSDQDWDLVGFTRSEIELSKTIIGAYVVGHSTAYARLIQRLPAVFGFPKGHRSFWSHFPPVGAFLRLLWLWWPFLLVFRYFFLDDLTIEFWGLYFGLMAADWVHSLADLLDSKRDIAIVRRFSWLRKLVNSNQKLINNEKK
jgi:hypothetical protein